MKMAWCAVLYCLCIVLQGWGSSEVRVTFHVVNDQGLPVAGVEVLMSAFHHWEAGEGFGKDVYATFSGKSDSRGLVTIDGVSLRGEVDFGPRQNEGYYRGGGGMYRFKEAVGGKWQPWNPAIDVVVKPIVAPIPMYARQVGEVEPLVLPASEIPIGFDLIEGDWVTPFGCGKVKDFVFAFVEATHYLSCEKPFDITLTVSFSNEGDGIQSVLVPINQGSALRLPRYAPENGYERNLVKRIYRVAEDKPLEGGVREDQNYFFRVRTIFDDRGKVKSALYGKINGDLQFWGNRRVRFCYCLNPTPLDRNMEFDPKRNLFGDLPFHQRVTSP